MADKNVAAMAELLLPHFSRIIVTTPGNFRASQPDDIFRVFSSDPVGAGKTDFVPDTSEAVKLAVAFSREKGLAILCTGSFYLAAEVRGILV